MYQVLLANASAANPAWSPDGRRIIFTDLGVDESTIGVMNADGAARAEVPGSEGAAAPAWSPDGERIAFVRFNNIWTMKPDGSDQTNPAGDGSDRPAANTDISDYYAFFVFDPDGFRIEVFSPGTEWSSRIHRNRQGTEPASSSG